ncbi:MAG: nuclear transport factor 2 family protein [Bdellovibrionales bacterium]|nr:nuclear transport factor 2 family protein [Bdellovibrionales bacterium]
MSKNLTSVELFQRSLDTFLAKDMRQWADYCDENIIVEFPFAPEGSPARFEGRAAIYEYLKNYPDFINIHKITSTQIYATSNPNTVIAEWSVSGKVVGNGNPYEMSYATFATFRDGLMTSYREYWNPLAFQKAMSGASFSS